MSEAWKGGSTRRWRQTRAVVLANNAATNGGRCTLAIEGVCSGTADSVHHVLGRAVTGDDPRWPRAVCGACNSAAGDPMKRKRAGSSSTTPRPRRVSKW